MTEAFRGFLQHVQGNSSVDNRMRTCRDSTIATTTTSWWPVPDNYEWRCSQIS